MPRSILVLLLFSAAGAVHAQSINCASVPKTMPLRASVLAPIASELVSPSEQLSVAGGVLARAYDESQSVDQVLLRMRIESCKNVAAVIPAPSVVDPLDPAAYKPKTQFDNTPWRFNMTQNGKSMTADAFSAWMQSRGVRVARGNGAAVVPPVAVPAVPGAAPPPGVLPPAPAMPPPPGALPPAPAMSPPPGALPPAPAMPPSSGALPPAPAMSPPPGALPPAPAMPPSSGALPPAPAMSPPPGALPPAPVMPPPNSPPGALPAQPAQAMPTPLSPTP